MKDPRRFKFTQKALTEVVVPDGKPSVEVHDTDVLGLVCRISKTGRMTMIVYRRVAGKPRRKILGEYYAGPAATRTDDNDTPRTIDDFRKKARGEMGDQDQDPHAWIEGDTTQAAEKITLEKAFELALESTKKPSKPAGRGWFALKDWNNAQDNFLRWMKVNFSHIETWATLKRHHLKQYMQSIKPSAKRQAQGITQLSATRMRLLMQPIVQTSKHMHREYELFHVADGLGLSSRLQKPPAPVYVQDMASFLDHLRDNGQVYLEAGAVLAGLAGLQMLEALHLTWDKVDLKRGLIEISGEVKNDYRNRVVPIPSRCLEALQRAAKARPLGPVASMDEDHVVLSAVGMDYAGPDRFQAYSREIQAAIRVWNPRVQWKTKDLRN